MTLNDDTIAHPPNSQPNTNSLPDNTKKWKVGSPSKPPITTTTPTASTPPSQPGDDQRIQPTTRQLHFLKPLSNTSHSNTETLSSYAGAVARLPNSAINRAISSNDRRNSSARSDAMLAVQYLLHDQQRRDEAQRHREEAREAAQRKREEEREAARRNREDLLHADQQRRDEQRDQQFTQLGQLLASLTQLVVQSNSNQAQLLERQTQLERQLQPQVPMGPNPSSTTPTNNTSPEDHSCQADMECDSDQTHHVRQHHHD